MGRRLLAMLTTIGMLSLLLAAPAMADTSFTVTTTADTVDAAPGDGFCADANGDCSLRAAVQEANALAGDDQIVLAGTTYTLTITGAGEDLAASGDLDVTSSIDLQANGATIDAGGLDRAFDILAGASLSIDRAHLTGGTPPATESGGAVRSAGTLSVSGSTLTGNTAVGAGASGGAIFNSAGSLTIDRSALEGNGAERAGGAIEANAGSTVITNTTLAGNTTGPTPGNGGALHLTGAGTVEVSRSDVHNNSATAEGGGLWNSAVGTMTVSQTRLVGNVASGAAADEGGGALFNDGGSLIVTRAEIHGNSATGASGSGGGILNNLGALSVERSVIAGNMASRAGGGIEANAGTTTIDRTRLSENMTGPNPGNGGALHLTGAGTVDVSRSDVRNNTAAAEGGGLWNSAVGSMTVSQTSLIGNVASGDAADQGGGALFNDGGSLTAERSEIHDNVADGASGSGGGILNNLGTLTVDGSVIAGNSASRAGGGIEANVGTTTITNTRLSRNDTGPNPGNGGGLHLTGTGSVEISGSEVTLNSAANEGGGLWNSATGTMIVTDTEIRKNVAPVGPNVFNDGGTFLIDGEPVPVG